jgi:hypothetical protein
VLICEDRFVWTEPGRFNFVFFSLRFIHGFASGRTLKGHNRRACQNIVLAFGPAAIRAMRTFNERFGLVDLQVEPSEWRFFGNRLITEAKLFIFDAAVLADGEPDFVDLFSPDSA